MNSDQNNSNLEKKLQAFEFLLDINSAISSTLDFGNLLKTVIEQGKLLMKCEACSLMLLDQEKGELYFDQISSERDDELMNLRVPLGKGIAGHCAATEKTVLVNDVSKDKHFYQTIDNKSGFTSKTILCVPLKTKDLVIGIIEAINPNNEQGFDEIDVNAFERFSDLAAIAIDKIQNHKRILAKERIDHDLHVARQIQQHFLPTIPEIPGRKHIFAKNIPARQVGGDFYDFFYISQKKIGIVIGDVAGKGIFSALYMVKTMTDFHFHARYMGNMVKTFKEVNSILYKASKMGMFVTLIYLVFDLKTNTIEYINAGHPPILIKNSRNNDITELDEGRCAPLGALEGVDVETGKYKLSPDETVILYTDGVIEATNDKEEEFGIERLIDFVRAQPPEYIGNSIMEEVLEFTGEKERHDDITIVTF